MFDYKYSDIKGITPEEFFKNDLLDFTSPVSLKTGEVMHGKNRDRNKNLFTPKTKMEAVYNHCKFIITNDKYINFSGSLHEFRHGGINYTDFTFPQLVEVTKDLYEKLHINPFLDQIHNIEFGVNVILPFSAKTLLKSIISFKGQEYELRKYNGKGFMIKFSFDQYELKIYDKGSQYKLPDHILRFEIKVTRMNFLHSKGISINHSSDLLSQSIHRQLGALLIDFFKQLVIFDPSIKLDQLKSRERTLLTEGRNPKYWMDLRESNPENYKKKLKRFRQLVVEHGTMNLQQTVFELIYKKWEMISNPEPGTIQKVNAFLAEMSQITFPEITDLSNYNFPHNTTSNSMLLPVNIAPMRRECRSCGRDISGQNPRSVFCSEKVFGKIAKKCRNLESNPRNNFKRREEKILKNGILFDINQFLIEAIKEKQISL